MNQPESQAHTQMEKANPQGFRGSPLRPIIVSGLAQVSESIFLDLSNSCEFLEVHLYCMNYLFVLSLVDLDFNFFFISAIIYLILLVKSWLSIIFKQEGHLIF